MWHATAHDLGVNVWSRPGHKDRIKTTKGLLPHNMSLPVAFICSERLAMSVAVDANTHRCQHDKSIKPPNKEEVEDIFELTSTPSITPQCANKLFIPMSASDYQIKLKSDVIWLDIYGSVLPFYDALNIILWDKVGQTVAPFFSHSWVICNKKVNKGVWKGC